MITTTHRVSKAAAQALAVGLLLLGAATTFAQSTAPPPIRPTVDSNGVDLFRGTLHLSVVDLVIGQPDSGGLTYSRTLYPEGWRSDHVGTIKAVGNVYTVSVGDHSESFTLEGTELAGEFYSNEGRGAKMFSGFVGFGFEASDGTYYSFNRYTSAGTEEGYLGFLTSVSYPNNEYIKYEYVSTACTPGCSSSTKHRLQSITSNRGYQLHLNYALNGTSISSGQLSSWVTITGVIGINLANEYCAPTAQTCSLAQSWPTVAYGNPSPGVHTVTDAVSGLTTYTKVSNTLFTIRRPGSTVNDVTIGFTNYSGAYRVSSVATPGTSWTYSYSDNGSTQERTTIVEDALNQARILKFDLLTKLPKSDKNAAAEETKYLYDQYGRLMETTRPTGERIVTYYDDRGNQTETYHYPAGENTTPLSWFAYFDGDCLIPRRCNKVNYTIDPMGNRTDYEYHEDSIHYSLKSVTLPPPSEGAIRPKVTYEYTGMQARFLDGSGSIVASTETIYLLTSTWACRTQATCVNSSDRLVTAVGYGTIASGVANNLLPRSVTTKDGAPTPTNSLVVTTSYDAVGNIVSVDGPGSGDTTVTHYDALRRVIGQVAPDPDGAGGRPHKAVKTSYDGRGLPWKIEVGTVLDQTVGGWSGFSSSERREMAFDNARRPTRALHIGGSTVYGLQETRYNSVGGVECVAIRMNPANFGSVTDACSTINTTVPYGPDRITQYLYDSINRVTLTVSGYGQLGSATNSTVYSADGRLWKRVDANSNVTTYSYDVYGRLKRIKYPNPANGQSYEGDFEEFDYNNNSELTSVTRRSGGTIIYERDALGRVKKKDLPGTTTEDVYYSYDLQGRLRKALYGSPTGTGIELGHDTIGRVDSRTVFDKVIGYGYDSAGRRNLIVYPGDFSVTYGYTMAGELHTITDSASGLLATHGYDALGRPSGITRPNGPSTDVDFDAISRLETLTQDFSSSTYDRTATFTYTPSNQIRTRTITNDATYGWTPGPAGATGSTPDRQNKLTQFAGVSVGTSPRGEVTTLNGYTYTYDVEGQLRTASATGKSVTVDYNPEGMLRRVTHNGVTTDYVYDGPTLLAEYSGSTLTRRYVHAGLDRPVAWYQYDAVTGASTRRYLISDERGSIIAVTNSAGAAVGSARYSPDGQAVATISPFGFTGQLWIGALDLYYFKARMYSPKTGRFMQPDPIGYAGGMNLYAYVNGDPINSVDPFGLQEAPLPGVTVTTCGIDSADVACRTYVDMRNSTTNYDPQSGNPGVVKDPRMYVQRQSQDATAQEQQAEQCAGWVRSVQDFTGGPSDRGFWDDVQTNYRDTMDFDLFTVFDHGIGLNTPVATGTAPFVAKTWGGLTPGQAVAQTIAATRAAVRVPGLVGFRTPLQLVATTGASWAWNAVVANVAYRGGVAIGSTVRAGVNHATTWACSE